ncbi:MAG: long-chain-acyl-CoA synthetase [Candidatus Reddybacter sp.]
MTIKIINNALSYIPLVKKLSKEVVPRLLSDRGCFATRVEDNAERYAEHEAVIFENKTLTWCQLNCLANRYAHSFSRFGLQRGDTASLMMENRIEFVATVIALNKLGVTAALINTNLTGRPLTHCIKVSNSKVCIFGEERLAAISKVRRSASMAEVQDYLFVPDSGDKVCPKWAQNLEEESADQSVENPSSTRETALGDIALYIFTSGTTGLPKAAVVSNRRFLLMTTFSAIVGLRCGLKDRIYLCLPMYHGTGLLLGAGTAFCTGTCVVLKRKFSASSFLDDIREYGVTHFIYVGELCRYLLSVPENKGDADSPLITVMGNGLRPDIWHQFKQRFGINRVAELYGASEGNIGFFNLLNRDCTVGTTLSPHALVKYDVDADEILRNSEGNCIRVKDGKAGLLLGKITGLSSFEGYTNKAATQSKILNDVFEPGDAWFNTGDLMKSVNVGFALGMPHYQFVDRVGDTFRWKGENVSTNEVGEIINSYPKVQLCNVYGVTLPGTDGRAGMAALVLKDGVKKLDLAGISRHIREQLPTYAQPVFLRVLPNMETTGTFKMLKGELRDLAYDLARVNDPLYVMKPGTSRYVRLNARFAGTISTGNAGY